MDRQRAKELAEDVEAALQPLAAELGLQIRARGGNFDATTYTAKIECSELDGGVAQTPERVEFSAMCEAYGLKSEHLDATFTHSGKAYKVIGLATSRRRFPVSVERERDGKRFKFPADTVANALGAKGA